MKHFVPDLRINAMSNLSEILFMENCIRNAGEVRSILDTYNRISLVNIPTKKPAKVKAAATRKINPETNASAIFHDVVLPTPFKVDAMPRDLVQEHLSKSYAAFIFGFDYTANIEKHGKYVVPDALMDALNSASESFNRVHFEFMALVEKAPLDGTPTKDANHTKRANACWKNLTALMGNFPSVGSLRYDMEKSGVVVPSSIWYHVGVAFKKAKEHFAYMQKHFRRFNLNKLRFAYAEQCARNEELEKSGIPDLKRQEVTKQFLSQKKYPRRYYEKLLDAEYEKIGYFDKLSWQTFKTSRNQSVRKDWLNKIFSGKSDINSFLRFVCLTDNMDAKGVVKSIHIPCALHKVRGKMDELARIYPTLNLYKSEGIFHKTPAFCSRNKDNIAYLSNLFVDIDLKESYLLHKNAVQEEMDKGEQATFALINRHCDFAGIPRPSTIVSTGGGFHVRWNFTKPIKREYGRWNLIKYVDENGNRQSISAGEAFDVMQENLCSIFRHLGADKNAMDKGRVLRPRNSTNHKRGKETRLVYPTNGAVDLYNISDLASCFIRTLVAVEDDSFSELLANFLNNATEIKVAEIVEEEKKAIKEEGAKLPKSKTKTADAQRKKAVEEISSTLRKEDGFEIADLDEAGLKAVAANYFPYRSTRKLPANRNAQTKGFEDRADYKERFRGLIACLGFVAKKDNLTVGDETGVIGAGHRNFYALHSFLLKCNALRDEPKYANTRDVAGFMNAAFNETREALIANGIGKAWLDENFCGVLNIGDGDHSRGAYNNVAKQIMGYWENGHIRNVNAFGGTNYAADLKDASDEKKRRYKESPLGNFISSEWELREDAYEASLKTRGRFPQLGYTVPVERIMRDCGITDSLALEAGSITLFSDGTRAYYLAEWEKDYAESAVEVHRKASSSQKKVSIPKFLSKATSKIVTPALRASRAGAVRKLAKLMGYTTEAVNKVVRDYTKTKQCPVAYEEKGYIARLDLIVALDRDIELAEQGRSLKSFAKAIVRTRTMLLKQKMNPVTKVHFMLRALKLEITAVWKDKNLRKQMQEKAWEPDDPIPLNS